MNQAEQSLGRTDQACREMPRYKCHKEVWALKIAAIMSPERGADESDGSAIIVPADEGYGAIAVDHEYIRKHKPVAGGYYVVYRDGYKSFSPSDAFEGGYTRVS